MPFCPRRGDKEGTKDDLSWLRDCGDEPTDFVDMPNCGADISFFHLRNRFRS